MYLQSGSLHPQLCPFCSVDLLMSSAELSFHIFTWFISPFYFRATDIILWDDCYFTLPIRSIVSSPKIPMFFCRKRVVFVLEMFWVWLFPMSEKLIFEINSSWHLFVIPKILILSQGEIIWLFPSAPKVPYWLLLIFLFIVEGQLSVYFKLLTYWSILVC